MEKALEEKIGFESDLDRQIAWLPKDIPGWGIDADPQNNPTYPYKHWNGSDHERLNYERPPMQPVTVEVLHSIERPGLSCVFGTSVPPSGVSGAIRRFASEQKLRARADRSLDLLMEIIPQLARGERTELG